MPMLNLLWPTFALVGLIFAVWITLFVQRSAHMRREPPAAGAFDSSDAARRYFAPVEMSANNLANLFEMPVLFLALVPLLFFTKHSDYVQVALAWLFVVFRASHSVVHIGRGAVRLRFFLYLGSVVALTAIWTGFFVDMIAVANAYQATDVIPPAI